MQLLATQRLQGDNPRSQQRVAMLGYLLPFIYLFVCALTGYFGRNTRIGFWGTTFLAILVTPLVVLIVILLLGSIARKKA